MSTLVNESEKVGEKEITIEELEELSYYDFMAYMGVPFFVIGGLESTVRLAELCKIDASKKILVVGCGTGGNVIHLAKDYGCSIVGIDIAEIMIENAKERAEKEDLTLEVEFKIGDAYALEFENETFDAVLTEFVSQFLDRKRAYKEFYRVLKNGGCLGINEMYKRDEIPPDIIEEVSEAEKIFQELTGLPFDIPSYSEWKEAFKGASFKNIQLEEHHDFGGKSNVGKIVNDIGGYKNLFKILGKMLKLAWKSKKLRKRFGLISKAKRNLIKGEETKKYIGYILATGWK